MRLEHYPIEKLKNDILNIVGRYLDLGEYRVFFFGSRVLGTGTDRSDIDVGIEGLEPVPAEKMMLLEEEIENLPTLYKIEIVDFKKTSSIFREVALRHIEPLKP